MSKDRLSFARVYMGKPAVVRRCTDCTYCDRRRFYSGKWSCNNPANPVGVPVPHDLPCFVKRGSKEARDRGF